MASVRGMWRGGLLPVRESASPIPPVGFPSLPWDLHPVHINHVPQICQYFSLERGATVIRLHTRGPEWRNNRHNRKEDRTFEGSKATCVTPVKIQGEMGGVRRITLHPLDSKKTETHPILGPGPPTGASLPALAVPPFCSFREVPTLPTFEVGHCVLVRSGAASDRPD